MSTKKVNLNIDELKSFLHHIIHNNRELQTEDLIPTAVCIEGPAGLGKTSCALQLTKELDMNYVRLNLSSIEELGDLIGYPIRQFQLCQSTDTITKEVTEVIKVPQLVKKTFTENKQIQKQLAGPDGKLSMKMVTVPITVEKEVEEMVEQTITKTVTVQGESNCLWIDEHAVDEYIKRGYDFTGEKRMSHCPPEWVVGLEDKGTILILDDYTRADQRFMQAVMTLIETQTYVSWKLPKDCHIILTTNPSDGNYLVTEQDIAQTTRYITVNLKFDAEIWAQWAEKTKIDGRAINFLLMHPELVTESCNPRAIVTFFNAIRSIKDFMTQLPLIQLIGEGSVGIEFSTMFTTFINNKLDKLVKPDDILNHENESYILGVLSSCIGRGADYRADIASVLTTRFINYTVLYSQNNPITQKHIDRIIKLATDPEVLTDDLKYVLVKKILNGNKQKFQKICAHADVIKMVTK